MNVTYKEINQTFLYLQESVGGGVFGSVGAGGSGGEGGDRREGGKRGRRPGRKAQLDKQDMKAKLGECHPLFSAVANPTTNNYF